MVGVVLDLETPVSAKPHPHEEHTQAATCRLQRSPPYARAREEQHAGGDIQMEQNPGRYHPVKLHQWEQIETPRRVTLPGRAWWWSQPSQCPRCSGKPSEEAPE